jgi:S1-C subfamily serine protease
MTAHKTPRVIGVGLLITAALGVGLIAFGARRPQAIPATSPNETTSPTPTSPAVLTPTATPSPAPDTESLGQEAAQALVKLVVPADDIFNHAQGSGSIVDGERGLILTNWHILAAPSGILYNDGGYAKVYLTEGLDQFPKIAYWAQLLPECSDRALDLALLQITHRADDLTPVQRPLELPSVRLKGEGTLHTGEAVLSSAFRTTLPGVRRGRRATS